jgi:HSP20 family protein
MARHSWFPTPWTDRTSRDLEPFRAVRNQFDALLDDWFGRGLAGGMLSPRIDVSETEKEVTLAVELPGVEEKDIDVTLSGDQLTIKGEKKSEQESKDDKNGRVFHRMERSYGAFQRTMTVPYEIEPEKVTASFKDGVLRITLPKPADAIDHNKSRRIAINRSA